jgi:DNA-binding NarL/FixJ family response regulator
MMATDVHAPFRVVVVDDHPLLREATRAALDQATGLAVVGVAENGTAALRQVERYRPDVLLLDVHLPDMSGIEVARQVRAAFPEVAVLVLTGHDDVGYVRGLLQLGVRGYLRKTATGDEVVAAVRAVAHGQTVIASEATPVGGLGQERLTSREEDVLRLLALGRRNAEIADALCVSIKTVEFHVGHVLAKLGARSRTEAILRAHQLGLGSLQLPRDSAA